MPFGPLAGQPFAPDVAAREPFDGTTPAAPPRGMSASEIERLERFGGSLRQFRAGETREPT
jgi:hypothetical protein